MKCYIFGAGAHGRVVLDILRSQRIEIDGFLDDDQSIHGTSVAGYCVVGGSDMLTHASENIQVIVALGKAPVRLELTKRFQMYGCQLINAIHTRAVVAPSATLGNGICACAVSVINPDAVVGDAVIINTAATVDHDCEIEAGVHLSPGVHLAGRVHVGKLSFLGTGVSVVPRVHIGANTIIGAGSVVVKDIPAGVLAMGVPARIVRELTEPIDWKRLL